MDKNIQKGIGGAIIGASLMLGVYNPEDIDPITGVAYEQIVNEPEIDVYYAPPTENIDPKWWLFTHQKPETARTCGEYTIIKGDVAEITRDVDIEKIGKPYNHSGILEFISINCPPIEEDYE